MITIRKASAPDIPSIIAIAYEAWPVAYADILSPEQMQFMLQEMYSPASLLHQMSDLQHQFIVATDGHHKEVAFASFAPYSDNASIMHLHKIYVSPAHQHRHIGQSLIEHILKIISTNGATSLQLNVNRHNKARHFYEKMGFTIIKSEDIDIGQGYFMNDYVMEKRLV